MRVGSLFSGYGGLDLALRDVFGDVKTAWVSDIDPGACKILAHRFPDAPNLGDITTVDWSQVEPVDILTGGFPCQDVSTAGKRAGMKPGTRSGLWSHFAYAIDQLRPSLVLIENVRGLLSADAHSDVEPCPWCLGDGTGQPPLRALGAVLGDLADIGYDAQWVGLPASGVGGCHRRFREFAAAYPRGEAGDFRARLRADEPAWRGRGQSARGDRQTLLPTPRATDGTHGGPNQRGSSGDLMLPSAVAKLLPTPAVNDMGAGKTVGDWDAWTDRMKAEHGNGNGHGASLHIEALRLLPTPGVADSTGGHESRSGDRSDELLLKGIAKYDQWGDYAAAIARQEQAFGRPAPDPTETAPKGGRRLSCRFDEWLMGLPDGWITDVPGITHNETLKACGNGVVPQQAAAAIRWLLDHINSEAVA